MTERLSFIDVSNTKVTDVVNSVFDEQSKIDKMKNQTQGLNPKKVEGVVFPRKMRYFIFILLVITNLIINMDHGTIPAATFEIKEDLKIDNDTLGIFGSLVYFGNLIGKFLYEKNRFYYIFQCNRTS